MVLRITFLWLLNQQRKKERCKTWWPIPLWIMPPWDSSHVCSKWLPLEPFHRLASVSLVISCFHSHTVRVGFMIMLPQDNAMQIIPLAKDLEAVCRDRQLTQNTLEVIISLVLISEVNTHSARTQVLYIALIKNALILDTQRAVPICTFTKYMAWQRQLCMMLHCTKALYWS